MTKRANNHTGSTNDSQPLHRAGGRPAHDPTRPDFPYPRAVSRIGPVTQARATKIARRLREAYPGEPTPFLHFHNPYQCVVAVSLSAQTTDENVNKVLP